MRPWGDDRVHERESVEGRCWWKRWACCFIKGHCRWKLRVWGAVIFLPAMRMPIIHMRMPIIHMRTEPKIGQWGTNRARV